MGRRGQVAAVNLGSGLCLTALAMMSAWMAQIVFWQIVGWQISFRMNLLWITLPVGAYFFSTVATAWITANIRMSIARLIPAWVLAFGWIALMVCFVALGIRFKSIALFTLSAALFGAGLFPLSRHSTFCLQRGQPKFALFIAMLCGVALAVVVTSGTLFVSQNLLQLTIALACCLTIALCAIRIQTILYGTEKKLALTLAAKQQPVLAWSIKYAGCGVLMATPIALAPTIEVLCGVNLASFGYAFLAHYGAMLLPSILGFEWQHTMSRYAVLTAYVMSVVFGHIVPLLYVSGIGWFTVSTY
jgi:hypothetical protein